MVNIQQRAAFSAFIWTIIVMVFAGALVFWSIDSIPAIPNNNNNTADYEAALTLANQRLEEAATRISTLEQQVAQAREAQSAAVVPANTSNEIDANTAVELANQVAGRYSPVSDPELVDFQGERAWAVTYTPGVIYIRASDGQLLYVERTH